MLFRLAGFFFTLKPNIMKKLDLMQKALVNLILIQIKKNNKVIVNKLIKMKISK